MKTTGSRHLLGILAGCVGVAAVALAGVSDASGAGTEPTPTCRGRDATLVGPGPDRELAGTPGDDVIVSNGAFHVRGGAGDDVICIVRRGAFVWDGPGDDVVDTKGVTAREYVDAKLGEGADRYHGGPERDWVELIGTTGDRDVVRTGGGNDHVVGNGDDLRGSVAVSLGPGPDNVFVSDAITVTSLRGGEGKDRVGFRCWECRSIAVSLRQEQVAYGSRSFPALGFDRAHLRAHRVVARGGPATNLLTAHACIATLDAGGGDDYLSVHHPRGCTGRLREYGRSGDDRLDGSRSDDILIGGPGDDRADGDGGHDVCAAERTVRCEG